MMGKKGAEPVDIDKLRLLADVAETKNITRSGERLGYSQSGVSHALKDMEDKLGFPLFTRTKYGVSLTAAAETLLPLVRGVIAEAERLEQTAAGIKGLETGKLTIGTYSSISTHCLPGLLREFNLLHPGIDISLKEGGADDIAGWIASSAADIGFFSLPPGCALDWIPLARDPLMAVLPGDEPAPAGRPFPIAAFEGRDFIISAMGTDYDIHRALEARGVRPNIKYSSMDDHAIISMVNHHLGVSILPRLILTGFEDKLTALPLEPYFFRELGVGMRAYGQLSPAARKFVAFARERFCRFPGLDGV